MTILVRAEVRVDPAFLGEFAQIAKQLADAAAAEAGTVQYRWFLSQDPLLFVVLEEYDDETAAVAHNQNCAALLESMRQVAELGLVHVHGPLGPDLRAWIDSQPGASGYPPLQA